MAEADYTRKTEDYLPQKLQTQQKNDRLTYLIIKNVMFL